MYIMRRILILAAFIALSLSVLFAQGYGIEINGNKVVQATKVDEFEGFEQHLAHVQLQAGDACKLINLSNCDTWMVDLNEYSVKKFSGGKSNGYITCSEAGCYDFYIKLKYMADELYIGEGSNCAEPLDSPCGNVEGDVYLTGNGTWTGGEAWKEDAAKMNDGTLSFKQLPEGEYKFKVTNGTWNRSWGYSAVDASCSTNGYTGDTDGNVVFSISAPADVTISFAKDSKKICLTVSCCMVESYGSSVPSQCEDVMLQGFYWDSYQPNDTASATYLYGDTRWKTLLTQSSEIGAYFDLVWLPPSAYASGTGYHPRQYSNQSSDWGRRADLENLIAAFHNSGTKVVADMVVNHIEGMSSWCDFATCDFGEYGVFSPDGSYICKDDEMNNPANNTEELANECYGSATGAKDDGYGEEKNYSSARDLAHDQENVREFIRAYAKWLKNVMHYDGFRYDYCKGFHSSHINDYNSAAGVYISFMEYWSGNDDIIRSIEDAKRNTMALDFQTKYSAFDGIAANDYSRCKASGLLGAGYAKYAVTFVDSHDWFLRNNGQEFGGNGKSMTPELKDRLLQANAFLLSMPGVPCVFYPHWAKYKEEIKPMINARHAAGVHSESEVKDEVAEKNGYQVTLVGKNGWLILQLGKKATTTPWDDNYKLMASGNGYSIWVNATGDKAPSINGTPDCVFRDNEKGLDVTLKTEGGTCGNPVIYYTTDGSNPTTESASLAGSGVINVKETTVVKAIAVCGTSQSGVYTYTYTYKEPQVEGITIRFAKPDDWQSVYLYAWDQQNNNMLGAYPGTRMYQAQDGWYTYRFDASVKHINFNICEGEDLRKSNDLETEFDVCYVWADDDVKETDCETQLNVPFSLSIAPESCFFRDKEEGQEVTINVVGVENAMIYYTLDGSEPTTASLNAQDEVVFTVHETTTVKAFAQKDKEKTDIYINIYTYKEPQVGAITVRFMQPEDWEQVYIYAFTRVKSGTRYVDTPFIIGENGKTEWPGKKWTTKDENGWLFYTFPEELKEFYVIFNIGSNKKQTKDLLIMEDVCYIWNNEIYRAVVSPNCDGKTDETGIIDIKTQNIGLDLTQPMYNILGMPVTEDYHGIVIQAGRKYIR